MDVASRGGAPRVAAHRISVAEARALVEAGQGVLVDTRDRAAYDGVHAEGAISAPFNVMTGRRVLRLEAVPESQTQILYCA